MDKALELINIELIGRSELLDKVATLRSIGDPTGTLFKAMMQDPRTLAMCSGYDWESAGSPDWDSAELPVSALRCYAHVLIAS